MWSWFTRRRVAWAAGLLVLVGTSYAYRQSLWRYGALAYHEGGKILQVLYMEPKKEWKRLPLNGPCVFAHNRWAWHAKRTYGQSSVVKALQISCMAVQREHSDFRLGVQDISLPQGGQMLRHLSHKTGRDVDIAFVGRDAKGRVQPHKPSWASSSTMYRQNYNKQGRAGALRFDEELNWKFLMALRSNRARLVEKVLVEPHLKQRLLKAGERLKATAKELQWARQVLRFAGKNAADHEDHMHVRFGRRFLSEVL